MANFEAKVKATLDLSGIDSQLQKISSKQIVLKNVKIGNVDLSSLQRAMQSAGNKAGSTLSRSMSKSMSKSMSANKTYTTFAKKWNADMAKAEKTFRQQSISANLQSVKTSYQGIANSGNALNTTIQGNIKRLGELEGEMNRLYSSGAANTNAMTIAYRQYNELLATTKNQIKMVSGEMKEFASASQITTTQTKLSSFLQSGTKAAKAYGSQIKELQTRLTNLGKSGKVPISALKEIESEFKMIQVKSAAAGQNVATFGTKLKGAFGKLANYVGASTAIYGSIRTIKNGINEVVELDNALVDLKKTSNATKQELDDFYYSANDSAKKYGTTTKDIIQGAADWSRLGYNLKDSQTMSEVSSIFKSISPGMSIEKANDGLISVMKAYKIEAEDALDGVASKINKIGNTQAVSNDDIVEFLTRSSSAMAEANNTLDETIALGTAATEITRNSAAVGTALKTKFYRNCLYVQKCA